MRVEKERSGATAQAAAGVVTAAGGAHVIQDPVEKRRFEEHELLAQRHMETMSQKAQIIANLMALQAKLQQSQVQKQGVKQLRLRKEKKMSDDILKLQKELTFATIAEEKSLDTLKKYDGLGLTARYDANLNHTNMLAQRIDQLKKQKGLAAAEELKAAEKLLQTLIVEGDALGKEVEETY